MLWSRPARSVPSSRYAAQHKFSIWPFSVYGDETTVGIHNRLDNTVHVPCHFVSMPPVCLRQRYTQKLCNYMHFHGLLCDIYGHWPLPLCIGAYWKCISIFLLLFCLWLERIWWCINCRYPQSASSSTLLLRPLCIDVAGASAAKLYRQVLQLMYLHGSSLWYIMGTSLYMCVSEPCVLEVHIDLLASI